MRGCSNPRGLRTHTWSCGFLVPSVAGGGGSVNFKHTAHAATIPLSPHAQRAGLQNGFSRMRAPTPLPSFRRGPAVRKRLRQKYWETQQQHRQTFITDESSQRLLRCLQIVDLLASVYKPQS